LNWLYVSSVLKKQGPFIWVCGGSFLLLDLKEDGWREVLVGAWIWIYAVIFFVNGSVIFCFLVLGAALGPQLVSSSSERSMLESPAFCFPFTFLLVVAAFLSSRFSAPAHVVYGSSQLASAGLKKSPRSQHQTQQLWW
jgi:hypothetical protein